MCFRMDSDSDDQLLEDDEFPDIGIELSFANRIPPKPGIRVHFQYYLVYINFLVPLSI